jgi:hypothetical protein
MLAPQNVYKDALYALALPVAVTLSRVFAWKESVTLFALPVAGVAAVAAWLRPVARLQKTVWSKTCSRCCQTMHRKNSALSSRPALGICATHETVVINDLAFCRASEQSLLPRTARVLSGAGVCPFPRGCYRPTALSPAPTGSVSLVSAKACPVRPGALV